jgi:response regulator RpfG family c-di-GMP phosphodiesterase
VDGAELIAGVRALLRLKAAHDAARTEAAAAAQAHAALERAFDQLLHLLVHLLDLARPGAADRGRRLASAAIALAQRSDIAPAWHRDLELAALLWEIGDLGASRTRNSEDGVDQPPWRRAVVAREILADVDRLRPVATIVDAIYEHWDGTGFPGHMQRGEIPFRSRLLRVLIDFFAMSDQGLEPAQAIERLMHHAGTRYDPALLVQLTDWTHGEAGASALTRRFVAVDELRVGMVLAEDLMTTSGTMLLTTGAIITPGSLLFIQRRHASDPILTGPYIAR